MVRRIPIRGKLAGALAVPLLGLVAAVGIGVSANTAQARNVSHQTDLASASIGHAGLIGALQNERNLAVVEVQDLVGTIELPVDDTATARELTDTAVGSLEDSIDIQSDELRSDYGGALDTLAGLPALRDQVDEASAEPGLGQRDPAHEIFTAYSEMLTGLFESHDRFTLVIDDPAIRHGDTLVHDAFHATDSAARLVEYLIYVGSGPGGIDEPVEAARVAELRRDVDMHNASIAVHGTGPYRELVDDLLADPRVAGLSAAAGEAIQQGGDVDAVTLLRDTPLGHDDGYLDFRDEVVELVDARARTLQDEAEARRRLWVGAAVAVVIAAILVTWWVSRSITRPLRELSVSARHIATHRLPAAVQEILDARPGEDLVIHEPEPISVKATDEVADVASAFNDVQHAAIGLAVEQAALRRNVAESYVNLGRRNQNLLSRLLDAVAELEEGESDPQRQAQLYKLDHLATRIRRNAESLLVLSQADSTAGSPSAVDVEHVVRAALGEIENHERVLVRSLDPLLVKGAASADLAHLLAELIENGLRHSPPRELVEVSGRVVAGGYEINVVDHGLGMTPDEIERANQRLAGAESFTVTPAKYLGHYVTAVLAARHGIAVSLKGSVVVGIAAHVELPAALIDDGSGRSGGDGAPADDPSTAEQWGPERVRNAVALLQGVAERRGAVPPGRRALATGGRRMAELTRATGSTVGDDEASGGETIVLPAVTDTAPPGGGRTVEGGNGHRERDEALPERTASGLVRRVRGAHVPAGVAVGRDAAPSAAPGTEAPDEPSSTPVDGAEMQRFLTSLVGGVQRSLDEQEAARAAEDEDEDD